MDGCRWALGQNTLPERVISIAARLGYVDDGETPNTQITFYDYKPAPLIFEMRGLPKDKSILSRRISQKIRHQMHEQMFMSHIPNQNVRRLVRNVGYNFV
jgi:hypothetical protein